MKSYVEKVSGKSEFDIAIILGSGVDIQGNILCSINYNSIPGFPSVGIEGHEGRLDILNVGDISVLVFKGRFHYYEGRENWEIRAIPYLSSLLGCKYFFSTCAVGAVSRKAASSDFMVLRDHINFQGKNPLVGLSEFFGSQVFVDLKNCYDKKFIEIVLNVAQEKNLNVSEGVLCAVSGPTYETSAEVKMLCSFGIDVVSMSTVPEVIAAKFYGMKVGAVAVIANDVFETGVTHEQVLGAVKEKNKKMGSLLLRTFMQLENYI